MEIIINILGWIGTFLFVWAYYLVSSNKIDPTGRAYQWINLIGAIAVGISIFPKRAWPALGLEVVWATIAIWTLLKNRKKP